MFECNAIIESVTIGLSRDVFLDCWLTLNYGGAGQGFGGFVLGGTKDCAAGKHREQPNLAAEFIVGCLEAGDADDFNKLVGKAIRVRKESEFGGIIEIGHIIKDDRWFNPRERFKALGVKE